MLPPSRLKKNKITNKNEPRRETALEFQVTIPNRHREAALNFLATLSISNSSLSPVPEVPLPEFDEFDARPTGTENCVDDQEPSAPDVPAVNSAASSSLPPSPSLLSILFPTLLFLPFFSSSLLLSHFLSLPYLSLGQITMTL